MPDLLEQVRDYMQTTKLIRKFDVADIGVIAIKHSLSVRFVAELLEAEFGAGLTYEEIHADLTDESILGAAQRRIDSAG